MGGIRAELQEIPHEILAAERVEADRLTAIQAQRSAVANGFYAQIALGRGFLYGAWGLVESGLEFADLANPFDELAQASVAAWKAEPEPGKGWLDSFLEQYTAAQYRDLAAALGFDPATISREKMAQAYEAANYIFEDAASKRVLRDFAAEYVSLQNHESILQFTGGKGFRDRTGSLAGLSDRRHRPRSPRFSRIHTIDATAHTVRRDTGQAGR
ncbi:hypothetical protein KDX38_15810 [Pseudomonas sp. CDFA 602]|uniref:hypothetical protein n=1 Tax=Pseudomonas californiensis TaxID=2829823 RepID=UPI001E4CF616|nr:hypothetical protein [Pseudomonas californiensis]MCD5994975.1 hypothetical protein [Pseudomonas californiensis]MCD6000674.1 hypothetical protein [Pseudomonas californiensis]